MENTTPIKYASYRRKSTDDERQVLSLDSQASEIKRKFSHLKIADLDPESVSAHKPYKRPVFKQMLEMVEAGKIQGIVAWHPDRLSRNPIDAAQIIYLLDTGKLKDLKFCSYQFDNSPEGKMMLAMVMSQSKYSSDKLSVDIKRGMNKKATMGYRPTKAALGYLNSKTNMKGEETVFNDPERFPLVRQLWDIALTGNYTVPQLVKICNDRLHLTQPPTRTLPERKMKMNVLYRLLHNTFYYGYYEWPMGSGNWIKGEHQPMITEEEFNKVQQYLGGKSKARPKTRRFAFTGLMRCGSCGAMITAEERIKRQKNGNVHTYIFYRCTKKLTPDCPERHLNLNDFTEQVDNLLKELNISERFRDWAIKYLHEIRKDEAVSHEKSLAAKQRTLSQITQQLDNLLLKYTSPENVGGVLISDQDFQSLKGRLQKQKSAIEQELQKQGRDIDDWLEMSERTFNFARYARMWFQKGTLEEKRAIFACLGSNLLIKDQKFSLTLKKPFKMIFERSFQAEQELLKLEPLETAVSIGRIKVLATKVPYWSR
jgi:site-specific DNA recombinase